MPIDIGDVVLNFIADTTQLDAAYDRVGSEAPAKLLPVSATLEKIGQSAGSAYPTVKTLGQTMVDTGQAGTSLADAFKLITPPVAATNSELQNMAFALKGLVPATVEASAAVEKMDFNMREAKASVGLLGEATGVHLPRHIRGFVAELPGVGVAMEAAFSGIAIYFLIEALVTGIEKIKEFMETARRIAEAWEAVDKVQKGVFESLEDHLLRSQEKTAELTGNHLEALRLKLQLLDRTSLGHLEQEFEKLIAEADKAFLVMDRSWFSKLLGFEGSEEAKTKFDDIAKEVNKALDEKTPEAFAKALQLVAKAGDDVDKKLQDLEKRKNAVGADVDISTGVSSGAAVDPRTIESYQKLNELLKDYTKDITEAQRAERADTGNIRLEERKKEAAEAEKTAQQQIKLYEEVAKSKSELDKQIEKGAEDVSKAENFRLTEQLKQEEKVTTATLKGYIEQEKAAESAIDGEMEARQAATDRQVALLARQYSTGLISGQQYVTALKQLRDKELDDLIQMLNRKEQLVIQEARNEAALQGRLITDEEAKQLKQYQDLENKKRKIQDDFDKQQQKEEDKIATAAAKHYQTLGKLLDDYGKKLRAARTELQGFGKVSEAVLNDITTAFGTAISSWISGQESFGAAMEKALAQYLTQVASKAATDALYFLAWGIADSIWHPARAATDFAAAAEFAAIAGAAGAAGAVLGAGAKSGSGGSGTGTAPASVTSAATQSAANPGGQVNAPRLAAGGLVTAPTLAIVGDSRSGGGAREAILPLDDPRAMREIAAEIAQHLSGSQAAVHVTNNFAGVMSADNLNQVAKKLNSQIKSGRTRLTSRNTYRITKRG